MSYAVDMKRITHLRCTAFPLFILLFYLAEYGDAGGGIPGMQVSMPPSHVALSGDLHIQIASTSFSPLLLQLSRLEGNMAQPLMTIPVFPQAEAMAKNSTIVKIPCGYFSKGGEYYVLIKKKAAGTSNVTLNTQDSSVITLSLDVRWPMPQLSLYPENIQTYPQNPVQAILEFPEVVCPPMADSPAVAIPEFWLQLHYCGHSLLTCDSPSDERNRTGSQELYSEQLRGFPGRRVFKLRCELFGLAGHYGLFLRPTAPSPSLPHTAAYIKADWSEQFVFNVHAHSIFPCDTHSGGVTVLFQYPSCILEDVDRVRLFARLRANVASLAPPTTLEYVAEQRVKTGHHSLQFDCDLFTERYVEYCFVYVSQAITGAVADVRMDCVPTLPVSDQESGGWGNWSAWTQCSSTCIGGTRSRYRFCDSPPPRYGAKFCEAGHCNLRESFELRYLPNGESIIGFQGNLTNWKFEVFRFICRVPFARAAVPSKMPPKKKGKGKKKKEVKEDPNALTEVDKTFYELTIADLNRKLARLRSLTQELEVSNEELKQELEKVDEDRSDVIIYLKRILQEKVDEIKELEERIKGIEESMQVSTENYEEKITEMKAQYTEMHEQLTSEVKLLEGKLNSLEEFRLQRDDLMKKFENQETAMEDQEKRHKRELYAIERKFIIKKDQLKKDMEAKLLQLSTEFQDATELRIAATTHRVIRENISINNELDMLLTTQQKLYDENITLKKRDTNLKQQIELLEGEKKKALSKVRVQLKVIERLTDDHKFMEDLVKKYKRYEQEVFTSRNEMKEMVTLKKQQELKIKILEQNLHHVRCNRTSVQTDLLYLREENERLTEILLEGVQCIKDAMSLGAESDVSIRSAKRENLLNTLFTLLSTAKDEKIRRPSLETIDSVEATYARGDLGFVPKPVEIRSRVPTKRHIECQTATSFERFLQDEVQRTGKRSITMYDEDDLHAGEQEEGVEEELPSVLFFDESEIVPEEQSEDSRDFDIFAVEDEVEQIKAENVPKSASHETVDDAGEQKPAEEVAEAKDVGQEEVAKDENA